MNYLDFIENYEQDAPLTQYDKIKVIVSRARDLYEGKTPFIETDEEDGRKKMAIAQLELSTGKIIPEIHDVVEQTEGPQIPDFSDLDDIDEDE